MSKYNAIGKHLANIEADTVTITFDQFERLIGEPLCHSAQTYSAWWSNSRITQSHNWANEWLHNGWETFNVNTGDSAIQFRRVTVATPPQSPIASDFGDVPPGRVLTTAYRILRDSKISRNVKQLRNYECQICGSTISLPDGSLYAEAHHIQPLGGHDGPDISENIICVCPNHHAMLDYGVIPLSLDDLRAIEGHSIGERFVAYHNEQIWTPAG